MLPVCSFVTYRKTIEPDANLNPNNGKTEPIHLKIRVRWGMVGVGSEGELGTLNPLQFFLLGGALIEPSLSAVGFKCQVLFIFPVKDPHTVYLG